MNSLQPKKDEIIRHPLNELALDAVHACSFKVGSYAWKRELGLEG